MIVEAEFIPAHLCHGNKSITRRRLIADNLDRSYLPQGNGGHVVGVVGAGRKLWLKNYDIGESSSPAPLLSHTSVDKNMQIAPEKRK